MGDRSLLVAWKGDARAAAWYMGVCGLSHVDGAGRTRTCDLREPSPEIPIIRRMNPKGRGEVSEGVVIACLLKQGHSVSIPFGNNQRYDLILDEGEGTLLRIQVKTGRLAEGCVIFQTSSKNSFTGQTLNYRGQADLFMVYCPQIETIYEVPVEDCGNREMRLRVEPVRGGPKSTIRWAKDYEISSAHSGGKGSSRLPTV